MANKYVTAKMINQKKVKISLAKFNLEKGKTHLQITDDIISFISEDTGIDKIDTLKALKAVYPNLEYIV